MTDYTALWNRVAVNGWSHTIRELVVGHELQVRGLEDENARLEKQNEMYLHTAADAIEERNRLRTDATRLRGERDAAVKLAEERRRPTGCHDVDWYYADDEPTTIDYSALGDGAWFDFPGNER